MYHLHLLTKKKSKKSSFHAVKSGTLSKYTYKSQHRRSGASTMVTWGLLFPKHKVSVCQPLSTFLSVVGRSS